MATQTASDEQNEKYILTRNFMSSARLTYMHKILTIRQGYLLHSTIASSLDLDALASSPEVQILDLAAGNGIWAVDLAQSLGNTKRPVQITCLDISNAMFPPKQSWRKNMSFGTWSIFDDVKEEHVGRFDVIHIRFIVSVLFQDIKRRDVVVENVKKMLKPGGWFQWVEPPPPTYGEVKILGDGTCDIEAKQLEAVAVVENYFPISAGSMWMNELENFVSDSGFEDVEGHWIPMMLENAKWEADLFAWNVQEIHQGLLNMPHVVGNGAQEIVEASNKLLGEIDRGEKMVGMRVLVVIGRMT